MEQRHKGFVVGSDSTGPDGHTVWKVRVKDTSSPLDGQKLVVASTHNELSLAKGLNVNFIIGTIDDREGQKVNRAVDVRLDVLGVKSQHQ